MEHMGYFKREVNPVAMRHKDLLNITDQVCIRISLQAWSVGKNHDKILVLPLLEILSLCLLLPLEKSVIVLQSFMNDLIS